jgi:hypothetical protein
VSLRPGRGVCPRRRFRLPGARSAQSCPQGNHRYRPRLASNRHRPGRRSSPTRPSSIATSRRRTMLAHSPLVGKRLRSLRRGYGSTSDVDRLACSSVAAGRAGRPVGASDVAEAFDAAAQSMNEKLCRSLHRRDGRNVLDGLIQPRMRVVDVPAEATRPAVIALLDDPEEPGHRPIVYRRRQHGKAAACTREAWKGWLSAVGRHGSDPCFRSTRPCCRGCTGSTSPSERGSRQHFGGG